MSWRTRSRRGYEIPPPPSIDELDVFDDERSIQPVQYHQHPSGRLSRNIDDDQSVSSIHTYIENSVEVATTPRLAKIEDSPHVDEPDLFDDERSIQPVQYHQHPSGRLSRNTPGMDDDQSVSSAHTYMENAVEVATTPRLTKIDEWFRRREAEYLGVEAMMKKFFGVEADTQQQQSAEPPRSAPRQMSELDDLRQQEAMMKRHTGKARTQRSPTQNRQQSGLGAIREQEEMTRDNNRETNARTSRQHRSSPRQKRELGTVRSQEALTRNYHDEAAARGPGPLHSKPQPKSEVRAIRTQEALATDYSGADETRSSRSQRSKSSSASRRSDARSQKSSSSRREVESIKSPEAKTRKYSSKDNAKREREALRAQTAIMSNYNIDPDAQSPKQHRANKREMEAIKAQEALMREYYYADPNSSSPGVLGLRHDSRRQFCMICVVCTVVVGVALGLGLTFGLKSSGASKEFFDPYGDKETGGGKSMPDDELTNSTHNGTDKTPTMAPFTAAPTPFTTHAPTSLEHAQLTDYLLNVLAATPQKTSSDEVLQLLSNPKTSQYAAINHLLQDTSLDLQNPASSPENDLLIKQKFALANLWFSSPTSWDNAESWMSNDEDVCSWEGITCGNSANDGRRALRTLSSDPLYEKTIIEIDLHHQGLSGSLPEQTFSLLPELQRLILHGNQLEGNLPADLYTLVNLRVLDIANNLFSGEIQSEIGNLVNLVELYLTGNEGLNGALPPEMGQLASLETLHIHATQINEIPSTFDQLTSLTNFWLDQCPFETIPSAIYDIISLEYLSMQSLPILDDSLSTEIGNLINLQTLLLSSNPGLSGELPSNMGLLTNLQTFYMYQTSLDGFLPTEMGNMVSMVDLQLQQNMFDGPLPSEMGMMKNLQTLLLYNNNFSGELPLEVGEWTLLKQIMLDNNKFVGPLPGSSIGQWLNCEYVSMFNNEVDFGIPEGFGMLPKLTVLDLGENELGGEIPNKLTQATNLEMLFLEGNKLSGSLPHNLKDLTNLRRLHVHGNRRDGNDGISYVIPEDIGNMQLLQSLRLEENSISGTIPTEVGLLDSLLTFHIQDNMVSGIIPTQMGGMDAVVSIRLENNDLVGSIPQEVCDMDVPNFLVDCSVTCNCRFGCPEGCIINPGGDA